MQAGGFTPQPTDAFAVPDLRFSHGHVRHARRRAPAGRQALRRSTTRARRTSARAYSVRTDLVVTDCDDPSLATVTEVTGDLIIDAVPGCDAVELPALTEVAGDVTITDNDTADAISLDELGSVGGGVIITDNVTAEVIGLLELDTVVGDLTITDNGDATVALGSPDQVGGDLTLDTTGSGPIALGDGSPAGDLDLDTTGYDEVSGATAGGVTAVSSAHTEALMRAVLPADAFTEPVAFAISRIDPAALPPEGNVDPVVAYEFEFAVPTLNSPATLTFQVRLDGLDAATRAALLAALDSGRATLATKGASYQAFPVCAAGTAPTAGGCVGVARSGDVVRFTGVTGHFSTWAVAIVSAKSAPGQPATGGPGSGPGPSAGGPVGFGSRTLVTLGLATKRTPARGPLKVRVANANGFAIAGRLTGETVKRVAGARGRRVKLPAKAFRVGARSRRTVSVRLPRTLRKLLKRNGKVALHLRANLTDPSGQVRGVQRRLTPKVARKR